MSWQDQVRARAEELGLTVTSGYRTPEHNKEIGGSPTSYHMEGTRKSPGALDIGGTAEQLRKLFDEIRYAFGKRLSELYLNIPGGKSVAIKGGQYLSTNPEKGRKQHLHVAIGGTEGGLLGLKPGEEPPSPGDYKGGGDCVRGFNLLPAIPRILETPPRGCWSDVWFYGSGTLLAVLGLLMLFRSGDGGE